MYNVVIIGAGPVGSYLASILCKTGYKVLVLDGKRSSGENICCTGIISKECYDLLSLDSNIKTRQINSANIIGPLGQQLHFKRNDNIAYVIDRPELDKVLATRAQTTGTEYRYSTTVTDIEVKNKHVQINARTSNGNQSIYESDIVVIATGYGSKLPLKSGLGKISNFIIGVQTEAIPQNASELEIYLDHELAPGGFAWMMPTWENKTLVGLLCKSKPKSHIEYFLDALVKRKKIFLGKYKIGYGLIPIKPLRKTYDDRVLVIGEAAGQVKPTTGGGIYYGILSAGIAAEVINTVFKSGDLSAKSLSAYQSKWREQLYRELLIGYYLQQIWVNLSNKQINHLFNIIRKLNLLDLINSTDKLYFDWHSKTLLNILISLTSFTKYKEQL